MGNSDKLQLAFRYFDEANAKDPNSEVFEGSTYPKELLYAMRMSDRLAKFAPSASEALKLTARCQHLCRWEIPRDSFPMNRIGYLNWRQELKNFHARKASVFLEEVGYQKELIERVSFLLQKKKLKRDPETQTLEDVICLVFLEYYLEPFMEKHTEDKLVDILRKTWNKMSEAGRLAAKDLPLSKDAQLLIEKAVNA